jgi:hypothetical protein
MSGKSFDNILPSFRSISLEEMDNVRLMNRQDTKFVMTIDQFAGVMEDMIPHYRILEIENERQFSYDSIYFDEEALDLYNAHQRGLTDRYKVRFRKYINSNLAFLEVKHKKKGRTDKQRILVDEIGPELSKEQLNFIAQTGLEPHHLEAVLSNRFNRLTFVSDELNERLTVDFDLSFSQEGRTIELHDIVIAELKQGKLSRNSNFYSLMKKKMIRPLRISKYCIGVVELRGKENVKYNNFKRKILRLKKLIGNNYAA